MLTAFLAVTIIILVIIATRFAYVAVKARRKLGVVVDRLGALVSLLEKPTGKRHPEQSLIAGRHYAKALAAWAVA